MSQAGTNAGMVQERTRLVIPPLNYNAFIGQAGPTGAARSRILRS